MPDGRLALIEAATFAFAERGYEAADLRSIARAADVDAGLVRIHFGGKAGLWQACMDSIIARRAPVIAEIERITSDASATVSERLTALIQHYVGFAFAHPEVRQFVVRHAYEGSVAKIVRERVRSAASWQSSGRGQVLV
jgi:AcrR family transcriptional regulator